MLIVERFCKAVVFFITISTAEASEIFDGEPKGSIVLSENGIQTLYQNITGEEYDVSRNLLEINGSPALMVLARDVQYLTLKVQHHQVLIDCAYLDTRNNYNGARMTTGVCGLNLQLEESYSETARMHSEIFSN